MIDNGFVWSVMSIYFDTSHTWKRKADGQTNKIRQTDRQIHQTDRQTDRLTDTQIDRR